MTRLKIKLRHTLMTALAVAFAVSPSSLAAQDAAATYKTKCSACHGVDGKGETPVGKKMGIKDLASPEVQKLSDDELVAIIADGKDKMPSYKKSLKPEQIKDLVGFVRSCGKK